MKNYYQILNINPTATDADIKQSYRILAKRYHPDVNPDARAADRFADISEAYEVLSNAEKRAAYDKQYAGAQFAINEAEANSRRRAAKDRVAEKQESIRQAYMQREAMRRQQEEQQNAMRALILETVRAGGGNSAALAERVVAKAQATVQAAQSQLQAQAFQFRAQLVNTERKARADGIAEGKRMMQSTIDSLNTELKVTRAENLKLYDRLAEVGADRSDVEKELFSRDRELAREKKRIAELEKQLQTHKDRANSIDEKNIQNKESLKNELKNVKSDAAELKTKLAESENARNALKRDLQTRDADIARERRRVSELEKQLESVKQKSAAIQSATVASTAYDRLKSELDAAKNNIHRLEEEKERQTTRAAEKLDKQKEESKQIQSKVSELSAELKRAQSYASELERKNKTLTAQVEAAQTRIQNQSNNAVKPAAPQSQREKELNDKIAKLTRDLELSKKAADKLQSELHEAKKNDNYAADMALAEQIKILSNELERSRSNTENLQHKVDDRIEKLNSELEYSKKHAEWLQNELENEKNKNSWYEKYMSEAEAHTAEQVKKAREEAAAETQKMFARARCELPKKQNAKQAEADNEEDRIELLIKLANNGDADSQNKLGEMYYMGTDVERDYDEATRWFRKAASQRHPDAMYNLGVCLIQGNGAERLEKAGFAFIRQAATLGSVRAKQYVSTHRDQI